MSPTLDTLPPEILFTILSYTSPFSTLPLPNHPLYTVAATSKYLCNVAEEYSRGLLKRHANLSPPKTFKSGAFTCRRRWVRWLKETCQLCGRKSTRKAILEPGLTCCNKCDRDNYPKMTQTEAITTHGLSKLDLFTPNRLHPTLPPLVLGTYTCMGGETLMLSTRTVLDRKAHIHDLLGEQKAADTNYLRRRIAAHDRLIRHMGVVFRVRNGVGRWYIQHHIPNRGDPNAKSKVPKSMASAESRAAYVTANLKREWEAMGISISGHANSPTIIEID
ncbi:hypothetical protein DM02DRAFT_6874 [Periconia macrospinosa]|uniref:Uncharacterized protein n=1 Tax=Periconia macrospinosa TaxID=97972 RepID=A0A2V1EDZ6_9PLEO|nr:hypothetical protein DM02DRAFT_6874 [Periconia macrospinosa]